MLPTNTLENVLASAKKLELGFHKKGKEDSNMNLDKSSSDSKDEKERRKKKIKNKKFKEKDILKELQEEMSQLSASQWKFHNGVICKICHNEGHLPTECQMKYCTICNTNTHHTNECTYNRQYQEGKSAINQIQPQWNNMRRAENVRKLGNRDQEQEPPRNSYYESQNYR